MATLTWNQACNVGVQSIDDQHGALLDALNELRSALLKGSESKTVRTMLRQVRELLEMHVASEEQMLARAGYPKLEAHRAEHKKLLARLALYDSRFESRQSDSVFELVEYMRKWFTSHTAVSGKVYGPWLLLQGVR